MHVVAADIGTTHHATPELAADWLRALQDGRDARHFPRPTRAPKTPSAKLANALKAPEQQLIDALDRADHTGFVRAWQHLDANWQLQQAAFDRTERQLQTQAANETFLQRLTEARTQAHTRWQALQTAAAPLLDPKATKGAAVSSDLRRLIGERLTERDPPAVLGFQPLPVRHLQSSAPPLPNVQLFTPDYLRASDNCANFDAPMSEPGPEAAITPEILAKASELGFEYTRIYDFVRTQILTDWYPGSQRGALGTLRAGRGNDVDQASLLIALLRASGVRAAYVHGRVAVPAAVLSDVAGDRQGLTPIAELLHRSLRSHEPIETTVIGLSGVVAYQLDYTWVVARLPWDDYRGSAAEQQRGLTCLPLDTALKQHDRSGPRGLLGPMQFDSASFQQSYLSTPASADPLSLILTEAESHLAATGTSTLADWLVDRVISEPVQGLIPPTTPFQTLGAIAVSESLPSQLRSTITLTVSATGVPPLTAEIPTFEALSGRLTLSFLAATWADQDLIASFGGLTATPAYLIRMRPQLSLDGRSLALGDALTPGDRVILTVTQGSGAHEVTVEQSILVGAMAAIVLAQDGPPSATETQAAPLDSEPEAARLLSNLGRQYLGRWNADAHTLAQLAGTTVVQALPSVAFVLSQLDVERVDGIPLTLSLNSIGLDAALRVAAPVPGSGSAAADWLRLVALQGSALEREVFDQQWATPAISADRLLAEAQQLGTPILDLQGAAAATQVQTLSHAEAVRAAVIDWLLGGYRVRIPESPMQIGAWQGSGWLVSDDSGSSGYFLSGGLAGGITVLPPDQWYLEDLAALLADPHAPPPNLDPQSGLIVKLDAAAQDQMGQATEELAKPLSVRVEDGAGRPVVGAQVQFALQVGEGTLRNDANSGTALTVATDQRGLAQVRLELGIHSPQSAIIQREGEDFPQRARYFQVAMQVSSNVSAGSISPGQPYRAYGMPGAPTQVGLTFEPPFDPDVGRLHPPGIGYRSYRAQVFDQYNYPVANVPLSIEASWTPPTVPDLPPGLTCDLLEGAQPAGVFLPGQCPADQFLLTGHACAVPSRQTVTRFHDTSFNVVPTNVVKASVRVRLTAANLAPVEYGFQTTGGRTITASPTLGTCIVDHGPWTHFVGHVVHDPLGGARVDEQVIGSDPATAGLAPYPLAPQTSFEAAPPNELLPLPRRMMFARIPAYADIHPQAGLVASWELAGPSLHLDQPGAVDHQDATAADIRILPTAGATVEDLRQLAPGTWEYGLRMPAGPAHIEGQLRIHYPADEHLPQPLTVEGLIPEAWSVIAQIGAVQPTQMPTSLVGTAASPLLAVMSIQPAEYIGAQQRIDLRRDGESFASALWPESYHGFFGLFGAGWLADLGSIYSVQATINDGTPYQISTEPVPVPIGADVIAGLCTNDGQPDATSDGELLACVLGLRQRELKLVRQIDVANQRVCDEGGEIVFYLAQAATVDLDLYPLDHHGVSGAIAAAPLSNQSLAAGLHRVPLSPGALPFGRFHFDLRADAAGGQSETESGTLIHQPDRRDHLALGHTIVRTVDLFDGQFVLSRSDAALAGRGPGLRLSRTYASAGGNRASPYGRGWNTLLDARLQRDACGVVQAIGGEGGGARFVYDYDDPEGFVVYRALDGYHSTLIRRSTGDWDLYALDGTRYAYGGNEDRLQFVEDPSGNRVSYRYETIAGRRVVVALEEDSGRTLQMRYEAAAPRDVGRMPLLVQLTGPGGIDVRYEYDEYGNLIRTRRAGLGSADAVERFEYTDYGVVPDPQGAHQGHTIGWRLSRVVNEVSGAQIDYGLVLDRDWVGEGTGVRAVPVYRVATLTETDAGTVTFGYSGNRGQPQPVSATVKNARGFTTSYTMNRYGGVELAVDPIGSNTTVWDLTHRKPASMTDAENVTTTYDYDAFGNTLLERISGNGDTVQASWTYRPPAAFDPPYIKNRPATATDFRGIVSSFDYDSAGRLTSTSKGGVSMAYGYDGRGDLISNTDWNGNTSSFHYNVHGLRIRSTWPDGSVQSAVFDVRGRQTLATDERGHSTTTTFDGFDRPLIIDPPGAGQRVISYDDATPARTETDELDRSTSYVLDKQGRTVEIINARADSRSLTLDHHGNVITETDFRGNTRTSSYDELDRRETLAEPEGRNTSYTYLKTGQLTQTTVTGAGGTRITRYRYQHPRYFRTGEFGVLDGEEVGHTDTVDGEGNVLTRTDALDRISTWTFDPFGRPLTLSEPEGRSTVYEYDPQGNLLSETASGLGGSRTRSFEYDDRHRQTARIDRNGERWTVGYDAKGNRIRETDPLGRVSQYEYDERDRMFRQTLPGEGRVTTYGFDAVDNRISETHPSGQQITHVYDDLNRLTSTIDQLGPIETRDYDPDGNLLTRTDGRELPTTATYDDLGRKLTETQPEGRNWAWTWNAWDQPLTETNPRILTTTHAYDTLGRRTSSTDPVGTQRWEFDRVGNLRSQTDRLNRDTEFDIDDLNRRTNQLDPTGHTQVWVHNAFDDLIEHTDRRGIQSTWAHDGEGRIKAHNRDGQTRMQYGYDAAGQQTSRTDPLNRVTRIDYDAAGRIIAERLPENAVITRTWHPSDDPASETDPDGLRVSFEYDERRRLTSETNALDETTTHEYDGNGNRIETTRPLQTLWTFEFDEANRLSAVVDPNTSRTEYGYDENGNRTSITDANTHTRTFEYDDLDRQTERHWPGGAIEITTLDAEGNPKVTLRPNGQSISRDFDDLNRLILETFEPVTEDGIASISFDYNGNGQITQVTETLSGATCPQGGGVCVSSYDYDELDRLISSTDRNRHSLSQRYDAADNRLARTGPEGETGYAYNGLNQITAVTPPGGGAIGLAPTKAGRWGEITHGNGIRTEATHDPAGRMNAVRHWLGAAAVLLSTYSFDANGNRATETIEAQSQSWLTSYTYDHADRLTGFTAPEGTTSYQLDPVGNRIQTTKDGLVSTADFDNRDRLTEIRDGADVVQTSYTYDAAGRQVQQTDHKLGTQTHYSYSATDRLIAIRQGTAQSEPIVRYEYHRLTRGSPTGGQRSARVDPGTREHYQWDGLKLTTRTNALGNPLAHYTSAMGWTLASVEAGAQYSLHTDALGTPLLLTDSQAGLAVRYRYDPWGVPLEQTKPHPNPVGFTGYLRDTATDQLYAQARQYQPGAGRFTSVDPWSGDPLWPVTLNQYLYGNANPARYVDPTGWGVDSSHYYTTYWAALETGYEDADARKLAFYAQLPDEVDKWDASATQADYLWSTVLSSPLGVPAALYTERKFRARRDDAQGATHVLLTGMRGEDVTAAVLAAIERVDKSDLATTGFLIHPLGDSFFHRDGETMHKTGMGHTWPNLKGHSPDYIQNNPEMYMQYMDTLVKTLGRRNGKSEREIEEISARMQGEARAMAYTPRLKPGTGEYATMSACDTSIAMSICGSSGSRQMLVSAEAEYYSEEDLEGMSIEFLRKKIADRGGFVAGEDEEDYDPERQPENSKLPLFLPFVERQTLSGVMSKIAELKKDFRVNATAEEARAARTRTVHLMKEEIAASKARGGTVTEGHVTIGPVTRYW